SDERLLHQVLRLGGTSAQHDRVSAQIAVSRSQHLEQRGLPAGHSSPPHHNATLVPQRTPRAIGCVEGRTRSSSLNFDVRALAIFARFFSPTHQVYLGGTMAGQSRVSARLAIVAL